MDFGAEKKNKLKVSTTERNLKSANPSSKLNKNNFNNNITNMNNSIQMKENNVIYLLKD